MEFASRIEQELKCPGCHRLFFNAVLLPCGHTVCSACVLLRPDASQLAQSSEIPASRNCRKDGSDSNVVCSDRDVITPDDGLIQVAQTSVVLSGQSERSFRVTCPACRGEVWLDDPAGGGLPRNVVMETIVDRYKESREQPRVLPCQMCPAGATAKESTVMCEQCEVLLCTSCSDDHRQSLTSDHKVISTNDGRARLLARHRDRMSKCLEHKNDALSAYCAECRTCLCSLCCLKDLHALHELSAIGQESKKQKSELTRFLHVLWNKVKDGTDFIQTLVTLQDQVERNSCELENGVESECEGLIGMLRQRTNELLEVIRQRKTSRQKAFKEKLSVCKEEVRRLTGLLQFSVELLKESDASAFLQISEALFAHIFDVNERFVEEMKLDDFESINSELNLDIEPISTSISRMNFVHLTAPKRPKMLNESRFAEGNAMTIRWECSSYGNCGSGLYYVLEIDDGFDGEFVEVYRGQEAACTLEGLHFDAEYRARAKTFNDAGQSEYSEIFRFRTDKVACFSFDPTSSLEDVLVSNNQRTVTTSSYDERVILGTVCFSRGIHYWEVTVDRFENNKDPAFGIARIDVAKDKMLGKDEKGWSMYIDDSRSWFMHHGKPIDRTDGGIHVRSTIGVLLDLDQGRLQYFVDHRPQGPSAAFADLRGVFYPAVSLNRNIQVTLRSGLPPPTAATSNIQEAKSFS